MKKNVLKVLGFSAIIIAFTFIAFGSVEDDEPREEANKICCVCSGDGEIFTNNGSSKCGTCYGIGRLTDGRHKQVCK